MSTKTLTVAGIAALAVQTAAAYLSWLGNVEVPTDVLVGTTGVVFAAVAKITHERQT